MLDQSIHPPVTHAYGPIGSALVTACGACLWGAGNLATYGPTAFALVGPVMLGAAGLWQAKTAAERLRFERRRWEAERASKEPKP